MYFSIYRRSIQVRESKERLEKVSAEVLNVSKELSDAHGDTAESERTRKQNETIDNLKRIFPGRVYGRLVDLCQPSHKRFLIAITKVFFSTLHIYHFFCGNFFGALFIAVLHLFTSIQLVSSFCLSPSYKLVEKIKIFPYSFCSVERGTQSSLSGRRCQQRPLCGRTCQQRQLRSRSCQQ
ncbi:unnamed protein product [Gongylonema pulchrum]|uniref:V-SNARE coiled-coil homology domain-containing protein n=1 Tax=Gongylonema pulchrum TaxID=637853 RepID=A0A183EZJ9_9BILA|nr:unnamed protein product [Gongylonema pulchrum]